MGELIFLPLQRTLYRGETEGCGCNARAQSPGQVGWDAVPVLATPQYLELLFSSPSGIILPAVADRLLCAALGLGCGDRGTSYSPEVLMYLEDSL